jgi:hypothetical protein
MKPRAIFERLVKVAEAMASLVSLNRHGSVATCRPEQIPIALDDDGTGNAIADFLRAEGYKLHLLSAASNSTQPDRYYRRRDELWFHTANKAGDNRVWLGDIPRRRERTQRG